MAGECFVKNLSSSTIKLIMLLFFSFYIKFSVTAFGQSLRMAPHTVSKVMMFVGGVELMLNGICVPFLP